MKNAPPATEWFRTDVAQAWIAQVTTQEHGLTATEIANRRQRYGENRLTVRAGKGPLVRFLLQFH